MEFKMLNMHQTKDAIKESIDQKLACVLDILESRTITEMRDAPDNAMYPLSRNEVERLLSQYERRSDDPYADYNSETERSVEGAKRARWYPPEVKSDWVLDPSTLDSIHDPNNRPAKLMPYDYLYSVYKVSDSSEEDPDKISDVDDPSKQPDNFSGMFNVFESEDETGASCLAHVDATGSDLELELADGNVIYIDRHALEHFKNSKTLGNLQSAMGSIDDFQDFLDHSYGKTEPVEHDPIIKPAKMDDYSPVQESTFEKLLVEAAKAQMDSANPNFKDLGRMAMVNRVRGGQVQFRKMISNMNGFKIQDGTLVRMQPNEIRKRHRGARIAAMKKKGEMSRIERARKISLRIRANRLGQFRAMDDV